MDPLRLKQNLAITVLKRTKFISIRLYVVVLLRKTIPDGLIELQAVIPYKTI